MSELKENNIPITEPQRQEYFMSELSQMIYKMSLLKGRQLTYSIQTFGCQMNARDSEKLSGVLTNIGLKQVDSEDVDVILFNTCTVRENANDKLYGRLGRVKNIKKKNKDMIIGICGCMMQEKEEVLKIKSDFRYVDIIFGTHNIYKLAELLYKRLAYNEQIIDVMDEADAIVERLPNKRDYKFKSGVNIMFGCNNFCSYCIVPYVRGRERSREPQEIIDEIKSLVNDGVVEIMLLGQNVNSYGKTLENKMTFTQLIREVSKIEGLKRIRFMTSHPKDLSDELIEELKNNKKLCRHLHLPLQSGSSEILKQMNRRYTKEQYLNLVNKIKTSVPDISISTDIIVGFPGESEEDFMETLDVVDKAEFDTAFTFIYSKRSGTPAAKIVDDTPEIVIKDRFNRLLKLVHEHSSKAALKNLGMVMDVLVEGEDTQQEGYVTGRLSNNMIVHFEGDSSLIGNIVNVRLDEAKGFYYMGTMVN